MTISNGYASLDDYKKWIAVRGHGTVSPDASDDATIEALIEGASRYFDSETGRIFYKDSTDTDYYFQASDEYCVDLPDFASITTVAVDYSAARSYTALVATDWDALPDNYNAEGKPINGLAITPTSTAYFPTQRRGVKVTGKRGFPSVPTDIKDAVLAIAQSVNGTRTGQSAAGKMTVTASGIVIRPEDVPPFAQAVIMHYRNIR